MKACCLKLTEDLSFLLLRRRWADSLSRVSMKSTADDTIDGVGW